MSYQVLARKWRPKKFSEVIGQQHVLQALINALRNNRLHHAYLFSGTRGVGKTTLARIFAKSLNCEDGITAEPCGICGPCTEIDEGRFVDLIEVDAASRTKVEDTRELLENVQYAPSRGRFKVYLIDEVHMLSNHSFNALLKTLEEPPPHVKFLLATTDPQKLPVTVLSRCLQFNLMNMSAENVVTYLAEILTVENIPFEDNALWQIGRAAEGSMRDALSLTDQAIAFSDGDISDVAVSKMLGSLDRNQVYAILDCLVRHDAVTLLDHIKEWSAFSPDYHQLLTELLTLLHRVAVAQIVPSSIDNSFGDGNQVLAIASSTVPQDIQLYYQFGMIARRDLPLAPDARSGFEMALLRMMVFSPEPVDGQLPPLSTPVDSVEEEPEPDANSKTTGSLASHPGEMDISADVLTIPKDQFSDGEYVQPINMSESTNNGASVESEKRSDAVVSRQVEMTASAPHAEPVVSVENTLASKGHTGYSHVQTTELELIGDVNNVEYSAINETVSENHQDIVAVENALDDKPVMQNQDASQTVVHHEGVTNDVIKHSVDVNSDTEEPGDKFKVVTENNWPELFWNLNLDGMTESIFGNSVWQQIKPGEIEITVDSDYEALYSEGHAQKLQDRLSDRKQSTDKIQVKFGEILHETPNMYRARVKEEQRINAVSYLKAVPFVQQLEQEFGGKLDEFSIRPNFH